MGLLPSIVQGPRSAVTPNHDKDSKSNRWQYHNCVSMDLNHVIPDSGVKDMDTRITRTKPLSSIAFLGPFMESVLSHSCTLTYSFTKADQSSSVI